MSIGEKSMYIEDEQRKVKEIYAQAFHIMHETTAPVPDDITPETKPGEPKKVLDQIEKLRATFANNNIAGPLMLDYACEIKEKSAYDTGVEVSEDDRILVNAKQVL